MVYRNIDYIGDIEKKTLQEEEVQVESPNTVPVHSQNDEK